MRLDVFPSCSTLLLLGTMLHTLGLLLFSAVELCDGRFLVRRNDAPPLLGKELLQDLLGSSPLVPPNLPPAAVKGRPPKLPLSPQCTLLVILDPQDIHLRQLAQIPSELGTPAVLLRGGGGEENSSFPQFSSLLPTAVGVRRRSWCTSVLVSSSRLDYLVSLGLASLRHRLLGPTSRLYVATVGWTKGDVRAVMTSSWTYSMMDTLLLNVLHGPEQRWQIWRQSPFQAPVNRNRNGANRNSNDNNRSRYTSMNVRNGSRRGDESCNGGCNGTSAVGVAGRTLVVGEWNLSEGLRVAGHRALPNGAKFWDFQGASVWFTALPFPPYWEESSPTGGGLLQYSGTDYELLKAMAQALNFKPNFLQAEDWDQVSQQVSEREALAATVIHAVFPQRLEMYDFTTIFEHAFLTFVMAKPGPLPRWQSLYNPFSHEVWLSVMGVLVLSTVFLRGVVCCKSPTPAPDGTGGPLSIKGRVSQAAPHRRISYGRALLENFALLVGQSIGTTDFRTPATYVLVSAWLVFSLIIETAYRSNLTAHLTAPKYNPRAESLADLVRTGALVTMPPYAGTFRTYFLSSSSPDYRALGERFSFVDSVVEGLQRALQGGSAHIEPQRYQELVIAQQFTQTDGTTQLYLAGESITPGLSAWPLPHDAPYGPPFDFCIRACLEAGLYEKWSKDFIDDARRRSKRRLLQEQRAREGDPVLPGEDVQAPGGEPEAPAAGEEAIEALSLEHIQGPMLILVLGCGCASVAFCGEWLWRRGRGRQPLEVSPPRG